MPIIYFVDPANFHNRYMTTSASDPGIPAGYINSGGSDGATPEAVKQYQAGVSSGGFPYYNNDPNMPVKYPNGILQQP